MMMAGENQLIVFLSMVRPLLEGFLLLPLLVLQMASEIVHAASFQTVDTWKNIVIKNI
ncbi:hypothetical protein [Litorimonas sp.]|uniref:hypothetical protein n=1 Tax=Litorimonas sp. TaxID=1892381 RepID=UPI003A872607